MKKLIYLLMLLALLLLPARSAHALNDSVLDGRVIIGQDFTLKNGDTLSGDLVVIGGQAIIEAGATVTGNIVVIGGSLKLDGQAAGDAVVIGGLAALGEKASLAGDMVTVGGSLQRAEGAHIGGNVVSNLPPPTVQIPNPYSATIPPIPPTPKFDFGASLAWKVISNLVVLPVVLSALAMFLALFLHPQLDRVAQAIVGQPFLVGSIGLLTAFLAPIALVVLAITIILSPVALAVGILLALAWLFGVIALGMEVGDRFTKAIHQSWAPVLSAGFGTFMLAVLVGGINLVPCVGWMAGVLVGLIGIGAVVMTMFGTRPLLRPATNITPPAS